MSKEVRKEVLGTSTLTYKFQVTIPKKVLEDFRLKEGDILVFLKEDGKLTVRKSTEC